MTTEESAGPATESPKGATDIVGAITMGEIVELVVESTLCDVLLELTEAFGETTAPPDEEGEFERGFEFAEEAVV